MKMRQQPLALKEQSGAVAKSAWQLASCQTCLSVLSERMLKTFTPEELAHLLRTEANQAMSDADARETAKELVERGLFIEMAPGKYTLSAKGLALGPAMLAEPGDHTVQ
ncbi:MAG: hypothetical protein AAFX06_32150 [Planctomycetota bacterium]